MSLTVAITDHVFPDVETERDVLESVGANVVSLNASEPEEVLRRAPNADALIVNKVNVTERLLDELDDLAVVVRYGSGYENVNVDAATDRGIPVVDVPGYCTDEVATHALALMLACDRRVPQYDRAVRDGVWDWTAYADQALFQTKTVGIVGFGNVGRRLAEMLRDLGLDVVAYSRSSGQDEMSRFGVRKVTFEELLTEADIVSIHTALTEETHHLFDREAFETMRESAILCNTSRGGIVDQDALLEALRNDEIALAGLDVLDSEPPDPDAPLLGRDDVVVTPHVAWFSQTAVDYLQRQVAEEVVRVFRGEPPENVVNPEVFEE